MNSLFSVFGVLVLGLICGTAINYFADVLPVTRRLSPATCANCERKIPWRRYLLLKDCEHCGKSRSWRSWFVVLFIPFLYLLLWLYPNERMHFWTQAIILFYFSIVAITDLEYRVILHPVSIAGAVIGAGVGYLMHGLLPTLIGGIAGFIIMLLLYLLGQGFARLLNRIRHEEIEEVPLGFGDVNLSGVLGLILGWPGITAGLLLAILLGGGFSALFILFSSLSKQYKPFVAIPYAPFLLLGAIILLFRP